MLVKMKRRDFLRYSAAGAVSASTFGFVGQLQANPQDMREIAGPLGNDFAGLIQLDRNAWRPGMLWRAGRPPFDHMGLEIARCPDGNELRLYKFSLKAGEAVARVTVPDGMGARKIGFRFGADAGMQLLIEGRVVAGSETPAAKETLTLDGTAIAAARSVSLNRLQWFAAGRRHI